MLVEQDRHGRRRTLYLAAAAIVALVVGFTGIRWFEGHRQGEGAPLPAPTETTEAAAAPTTTTALLSEADLMAVDSSLATLAAVARAEWFVTDYFTAPLGVPLRPSAVFVGASIRASSASAHTHQRPRSSSSLPS